MAHRVSAEQRQDKHHAGNWDFGGIGHCWIDSHQERSPADSDERASPANTQTITEGRGDSWCRALDYECANQGQETACQLACLQWSQQGRLVSSKWAGGHVG